MTLSPDATAGKIREIVTIVTDDAASPNVPLMVEGIVKSDITLANDSLSLGALKPGEIKTVQVVVQGTKPFAVAGVDCPKMQGASMRSLVTTKRNFRSSNLNSPLLIIRQGKFTEEVIISIKDRKDTYKCKVSGEIR